MNEVDQSRLNGIKIDRIKPKWTEYDQSGLNGPNRTKWAKYDQSGPKGTEYD